ncbi:MAG TPA: flagellar biosynthesis anti-sigma factor FlgM [Acidobacteriaceae bacterium]|nr:flagellar biosynthesis anti-sigma factor FlgM [Acidobacteriaceae bacterium]
MDVHDRSTYPSNLASTGVQAASRPRSDDRSTPSARSTSSGNDSAELSPAAQSVAEAMQMPEVRQDRVASLQQQIASGTYRVAPQDVADAMLRNLRG